MSDIHALSGAYAVDALDDLERAGFERHLAGCAACRAEVASLREATAAMADDGDHDRPSCGPRSSTASVASARCLPCGGEHRAEARRDTGVPSPVAGGFPRWWPPPSSRS